MARFLIAYWDGGGSVPPLLAIIRGLADRGHDVRVIGSASLRQRVEAAGVRFRPYAYGAGHDPSSPDTDLFKDWEPRTPFGVFARVRDRLVCGPALELARDTLDELEREPADAIAVDLFLFGAMAAAERAGIPWAALSHTVYPLPVPGRPPFGMGLRPRSGPAARVRDAVLTAAAVRTFDTGRRTLNEARIALGLPPLAHTLEQVRRAPSTLVLSSAAFDFPFRELPPGVRYVGPPLDPPRGESEWKSPWSPNHPDPLVLVSFSTTFQDHRPMLERIVGAFAGLPARGLVTLGGVFDPASIQAPANVAVRGWVPHGAVLGRARAVVTHAGHGTVMGALAAGVPLVCIPFGRDQHDNAVRVVHADAGVRLSRRASAEELRDAIARAIADPALRSGAERMASAIAKENGVLGVARELEALAGQARGPER